MRATGSERETDLGEVALVGVEVVDVDVVLGAPPALPAAVRRRHCGLASAAADHLCSGRELCGSALRSGTGGELMRGKGRGKGKRCGAASERALRSLFSCSRLQLLFSILFPLTCRHAWGSRRSNARSLWLFFSSLVEQSR